MMEEKISAAESRAAAPGLIFQSLINALQQRNSKSKTRTGASSSLTDASSSYSDDKSDENWKSGLTSTRRRINQTWEQYSPSIRDKVHKYSAPSPLRKLKTLFTLSEEKDSDYDAEEMEKEKSPDNTSHCEEVERIHLNGSSKVELGEEEEGAADDPKDESSQRNVVPSASAAMECDIAISVSDQAKAVPDHRPPFIVLEEADQNRTGAKPEQILHTAEHLHRRKSPLTVQEWVDHLPTKHRAFEKDCEDSMGSKDFDNLGVVDTFPQEEKKTSLAHKLSREASVQSSSSLDSILDSRRPDPVEVLLNLGFGGVPGVDMNNCRIPKRFLVPSKCKGGDWNEFLKRELLQAQNFECASLGFRGLSGPSYRRPSAIVANIMEKLRERSTPRHPVKCRFSTVAKRVLSEKSVLNKLVSPSQSVLSPDSRKFLESQGKISPEVPRRRIIFGQKSFAFGNDGEFIEVESSSSVKKLQQKESVTSIDSSSFDSDFEETKMSSTSLPSPEMMLKIRRSSLQRQKNVEEEPELSDIDSQMDDIAEDQISESMEYDNTGKDKEIPRRFVASANRRQLTDEVKPKTSAQIKREVEEEIKTLSLKIQSANSIELSSILSQMKELRTRLENSNEPGIEKR